MLVGNVYVLILDQIMWHLQGVPNWDDLIPLPSI